MQVELFSHMNSSLRPNLLPMPSNAIWSSVENTWAKVLPQPAEATANYIRHPDDHASAPIGVGGCYHIHHI